MGFVLAVISGMADLVARCFSTTAALDRMRRDLRGLQPDVHVVRAYLQSAGGGYLAYVKVQNRGKTSAYSGTVTLDGCPSTMEFGPLVPIGAPGSNECEPLIELGEDSQVRRTRMDDAKLWIRYQDQWGYTYEVSYPVLQERGDHGFFNLKIQTEQPSSKRPSVGFWKMRKILRESPD